MGSCLAVQSLHAATDVEGYEDIPGYAHLPAWSSLLFVGNQYAAASGEFGTVISAVVPLDLGGSEKPSLSSHVLHFDDNLGDESEDELALARSRFIEGASLVGRSIAEGKRTLVHCVWGQNRSGSIVCTYAVLYLHWTADAAISYMRERNFADRQYPGQSPMGNPAFCNIIHDLERNRESIMSSARCAAIAPQLKQTVSPSIFGAGALASHLNAPYAAQPLQSYPLFRTENAAKVGPVTVDRAVPSVMFQVPGMHGAAPPHVGLQSSTAWVSNHLPVSHAVGVYT